MQNPPLTPSTEASLLRVCISTATGNTFLDAWHIQLCPAGLSLACSVSDHHCGVRFPHEIQAAVPLGRSPKLLAPDSSRNLLNPKICLKLTKSQPGTALMAKAKAEVLTLLAKISTLTLQGELAGWPSRRTLRASLVTRVSSLEPGSCEPSAVGAGSQAQFLRKGSACS